MIHKKLKLQRVERATPNTKSRHKNNILIFSYIKSIDNVYDDEMKEKFQLPYSHATTTY